MPLLRYFATLTAPRAVLWCYLIWYLCTVWFHFDPAPALWLNALGISAVIGVALMLSVHRPGVRPDRWQTLRLFLMPFGVSSFSALIKGKGFVLIFSPAPQELAWTAGACAAFLALVGALRRLGMRPA